MTEDSRALHLTDVQGDILRPYGLNHGGYLFLAVRDPPAARRWVGTFQVTTAAPWPGGRKPEHTLNAALTYVGLATLGVPGPLLATFPGAFREGMKARAAALGDVGPSAPDQWDTGLQDEAHLVLSMRACSPDVSRDRMDALRGRVAEADGAVEVVHELPCHNLTGQREHFGFADGFGQPAIEGSGHDHLPGQGQPDRRRGWRPVKPGEFVLGYEDEDSVRPPSPEAPLGDNGSYMVLRKLEQNVPLFRRYVAEAAEASGMRPELVAAKLVGRWPDGTPLAVSPDRPDDAVSGDKTRINDFRYADDPHGHRCPIGSHVRRVNPRDGMDRDARLTKRHRMIRRGMPYGAALAGSEQAADGEADAGGRGLVFVCFVASIERQFEFVQQEWCNHGERLGLGGDRDFLTGRPATGDEPANKVTIRGRSPVFLEQPRQPFVVTKGGYYLFTPGMRSLRAIVEAEW